MNLYLVFSALFIANSLAVTLRSTATSASNLKSKDPTVPSQDKPQQLMKSLLQIALKSSIQSEATKEDYDLIVDYSLTEEDLGAIYEHFTLADLDKNQTLTPDELASTFDINITHEALQIFVSMVDGIFGHQYKDQMIFFDEYSILLQILLSSWEIQVQWYFKALDEDGDGQLSSDEWDLAEAAFSDLYSVDFDTADADGDGYVSFTEFVDLMEEDDDDGDEDTE